MILLRHKSSYTVLYYIQLNS
uniref:Uncharacterized protein n=1 Tax=Rhizophora mucronata TaxID=61149 RepID=A0A2P2MA75_RHIMU